MKCVKIALIFIMLWAFLALSIYGQTLAVEVTVIRAGRLFDSEKGVFLSARDIVIKGNLIESVGENLPIPKGAQVVDLRRFTVMPSVRLAVNEGSLDGPRMYVSGPGLSPEGGQFPGLQFSYRGIAEEEYRIVRGAEDARMAVQENVTYGANVIKIYSSASPNPGYLSMEEMRAIVAEARLLGVKVTAHATSDLAISRAVEAGVDSIEHGYRAEDTTLKLMKERGVALVPTYLDSVNLKRIYAIARPNRPVTEQELSAALKQRYERLQRAVKAGVTIVAGSDNYIDLGVPQGEAAKRVLFTYYDAGMETVQVLQSATINAARLFGEPRIGVIKTGAFADIIAVDGDPVKDFDALERVKFVMKNGKVYLGQP